MRLSAIYAIGIVGLLAVVAAALHAFTARTPSSRATRDARSPLPALAALGREVAHTLLTRTLNASHVVVAGSERLSKLTARLARAEAKGNRSSDVVRIGVFGGSFAAGHGAQWGPHGQQGSKAQWGSDGGYVGDTLVLLRREFPAVDFEVYRAGLGGAGFLLPTYCHNSIMRGIGLRPGQRIDLWLVDAFVNADAGADLYEAFLATLLFAPEQPAVLGVAVAFHTCFQCAEYTRSPSEGFPCAAAGCLSTLFGPFTQAHARLRVPLVSVPTAIAPLGASLVDKLYPPPQSNDGHFGAAGHNLAATMIVDALLRAHTRLPAGSQQAAGSHADGTRQHAPLHFEQWAAASPRSSQLCRGAQQASCRLSFMPSIPSQLSSQGYELRRPALARDGSEPLDKRHWCLRRGAVASEAFLDLGFDVSGGGGGASRGGGRGGGRGDGRGGGRGDAQGERHADGSGGLCVVLYGREGEGVSAELVHYPTVRYERRAAPTPSASGDRAAAAGASAQEWADGPDTPLWEQGWRAVPQGGGASPHGGASSGGEAVAFRAGPDPYSQFLETLFRNVISQQAAGKGGRAQMDLKAPRTYRLSCCNASCFGESASRAADASWALRLRPLPSTAPRARSRSAADDTDTSACVAGYLWDVPTSVFEVAPLAINNPGSVMAEAQLASQMHV